MILVLRRSLNNSPPLTCDMLAAKPSYCSVLLPAWILACPAVCSAYRTNPRIASGQSREDVTAQDLSRTGCLRGGCWSGRSGRLMSQLPLSPTIAQSTAGSRSTSGYRALLLVLLGLFAGKGHTKDLYPGRYIYICLHPKEVCPWRERDIPGTQLLQPRVWRAKRLCSPIRMGYSQPGTALVLLTLWWVPDVCRHSNSVQ